MRNDASPVQLRPRSNASTAGASTPGAANVARDTGGGLMFPDILQFRGYSKPVRIEGDAYDCEVEGRIPQELNGAFFRVAPDHQYPPLHGTDSFLNGDGMVHMVRFENGHADLKMRYVHTEKYKKERAARRALYGYYRNPFFHEPSVAGTAADVANTSILWFDGKLSVLRSDAHPMVMDPGTLETKGAWDFKGQLKSKTFTAHPKKDPLTGELVAFGYNPEGTASNTIDVFTLSPTGDVTSYETFEAPYCSLIHDFLVSRNYIVFTICPMTNDMDRVREGLPYWHWDSRLPTMMAVIPRKEGVAGLRWFKSPRTVMQTHTFNAWEEGSVLHCDHFINTSGWLSQFPDINNPDAEEAPPFAERWSMDLSKPGDDIEIKRIFNHIGEMPMVDPRRSMGRTDHYYFGTSNTDLGPMLERGPKGPPFTCLGHYQESTGKFDFYYAGPNASPEEPSFAPKAGGKDGEGWIITMVGRRDEMRTDLVILDALCLADGPVATVKFPCRVHEGFHGVWVPEWELKLAGSW